jgi:hypothetical protein
VDTKEDIEVVGMVVAQTLKCHNCDEVGHISCDFLQSTRVQCDHCRAMVHATKDCPKLIAKWETRETQCNSNLVNYEPQYTARVEDSRLNVVTREGACIGSNDSCGIPLF